MTPKQKRKRYTSLKPAKKLMRQGKHFDAVTILDALRVELLGRLAEEDRPLLAGEKKSIRQELGLVNHQLGLAYEAVGNEKMAETNGSSRL